MNLQVLIIILLLVLLLGGGGYSLGYVGPSHVGGVLGLVLIIVLILFLVGLVR